MAMFENVYCDGCHTLLCRTYNNGHPRPSMYCESCADREEEEAEAEQARSEAEAA